MENFKELSSKEITDIQGGGWWDDLVDSVVDYLEKTVDEFIADFERAVAADRQP